MLHPAPRSLEQLKTPQFDVDTTASAIKMAREQANVGFEDLPDFNSRSSITDKEKHQETPAAKLDASKGLDTMVAPASSEDTPIFDEASAVARASVGFDLPDFKDRGSILDNHYKKEKASETPAAKLDASIGDPNSTPQATDLLPTEPALKNSGSPHQAKHRADVKAEFISHEEEASSQSDKKSLVDRAKDILFTKTDRLLLEERLAKEKYQPKHRLDRDEITYEQSLEKGQEITPVLPSDVDQDQQPDISSTQHETDTNEDVSDQYEPDWIDRASDAINGKLTKLYYSIGNAVNKFSSNARKEGETDDDYSERMQQNGRRMALGITAMTAVYGLYRAYGLYHGLSGSSETNVSLGHNEIFDRIEKNNGPSGTYPDMHTMQTGDHTSLVNADAPVKEIVQSEPSGVPDVSNSPTRSNWSSTSGEAWSIPSGSGGEALMDRLGVDKGVWYEHQEEFLSKFPKEAYRMPNGNVGFSNTGRLSKDAIEFWSKYANK